MKKVTALLGVAALIVSLACAAPETEAQQRVEAVPSGDAFPGGTFQNLNAEAGGPAQIELKPGTKPIVLFYWIAGHERAGQIALEVEERVAELSDKVDFYVATFPQPGRDAPVIQAAAKEIGLKVPVIGDDGFMLGQRLRVQSVPNISIIDSDGVLRLTNGASLKQEIGYKLTVESAIERVAKDGKLGNYGYLDQYYPVNELIGQKCPDFKAPLLSNSVEQRWSTMLHSDKVNVLIFWSVDCPHCTKSMPVISRWIRNNSEGLNVVSAARIATPEAKQRTKEYCDVQNFAFPTLVDKDLKISSLFNVTTTPTILIIRPDGVVDSVLLSGHADFAKKVAEAKRSML